MYSMYSHYFLIITTKSKVWRVGTRSLYNEGVVSRDNISGNIGCAFKRYSLTVIGDGYSSNTASTSDYQKYDI